MFIGNGFYEAGFGYAKSCNGHKNIFLMKIKKSKIIKIVHSPNHTIIKGTDFLTKVVTELKQEGLNIQLIIIQSKQNKEVLDILMNEVDILVEKAYWTFLRFK